jgi:hypothetical protein
VYHSVPGSRSGVTDFIRHFRRMRSSVIQPYALLNAEIFGNKYAGNCSIIAGNDH